MNVSILPHLRLFGIATVLVFAASAATAQTDEKSESAAKTESAAKPIEKPRTDSKKASTPVKHAAPAGYATEAEAKAHCRGGVVWIGEDHFSHYPGSREYGHKPGAFACE